MYNYIVVKNVTWVTDSFETADYLTVVGTINSPLEIDDIDHIESSHNQLNTIFVDGVMYADPSELPNGEDKGWTIANKQDADSAELARMWRDSQLTSSDWSVPVTDHPQHADYAAYRIALRNWPSTEDFPATKPEM